MDKDKEQAGNGLQDRNPNWYSLFALGGAVYAASKVNGAPWGCVVALSAVRVAGDIHGNVYIGFIGNNTQKL